MDKNTILGLMLRHHALIETLLKTFQDNLREDSGAGRDSLNKFRWELEKHIFVEENVIFKTCSMKDSEGCKVVHNLIRGHFTMMNILDDVSQTMNKGKIDEKEIFLFQKFLTAHKQTEEKKLYPKLDATLSNKDKKTIIYRINEIPIIGLT